ncbi:MAG: ATP-binding cassette domain-containing protein, partial [Paracoccaceae bacterium]
MSLRIDIGHRIGELNLSVAFSVESGVTALFGPSGSGKTTVLKAISGLL